MTHEAATTVKELPEALPLGESILWQGAPDWRTLYRRAFHVRFLTVYFASLILLRGAFAWSSSDSLQHALIAMAWLLPAAAFAIGLVTLLAWLTARASWYTITDQRVVMRIGIVLEVTFNFPFKVIDSIDLHVYPNGHGDLALGFMPGERIAFLHLWPHVRPWHVTRTQPMLRCVPNAAAIGELLGNAMKERNASSLSPIMAPLVSARSSRSTSSHPIAAVG